jgi:hypothetical protein
MSDEEREKLIAQATAGLEAVIDEATGYQAVRPKDALRKRYAELGGSEDDYLAPDTVPEGFRAGN